MSTSLQKFGLAAALIAIVAGIILLVAFLQPEPTNVATIEANEVTTDPTIGPDTAPVTLREYSDFQCPSCKTASPIVKNIIEEYGEKVQFVYNDYPLVSIHEYATDAAISAQCAFDQDEFFLYHDVLFDRQQSWAQSASVDEARTAFRSYAQEIGLDMEAYDSCIANPDIAKRVSEDVAEGEELKVTGTPSFFVNGTKVDTSTKGYDVAIREAIDAALTE